MRCGPRQGLVTPARVGAPGQNGPCLRRADCESGEARRPDPGALGVRHVLRVTEVRCFHSGSCLRGWGGRASPPQSVGFSQGYGARVKLTSPKWQRMQTPRLSRRSRVLPPARDAPAGPLLAANGVIWAAVP